MPERDLLIEPKSGKILAQHKVSQRRGSFLVALGVFNLTAMTSHCRIWGK